MKAWRELTLSRLFLFAIHYPLFPVTYRLKTHGHYSLILRFSFVPFVSLVVNIFCPFIYPLIIRFSLHALVG